MPDREPPRESPSQSAVAVRLPVRAFGDEASSAGVRDGPGGPGFVEEASRGDRQIDSTLVPAPRRPGVEFGRPRLVPVMAIPTAARPLLPSAGERTVEPYPVSRAKVTPPPLRDATLSRDRLLDWLERHAHRRCITVAAETGFGKTTLLTDFSRRAPMPCLWYRLDPGDCDPVSFVNYVVAAVREIEPGFGARTLGLLSDVLTAQPTTDLVVSTLVAELSALGDRSTMLILDDYHVIDDDPRARALVTRLLADAPDRMSFVLLSRRPPKLALGRLVAQGEAPRLGADDLRFSTDETERLFRDIYHQPLETEVLRQVEERTEGWAAGLQLLHSSIRGRSPRDVRAFVRRISGAEGDLYDYLAEEVMNELAPEIQRFLTYTSILDDVRIELATAIFAADDPPPAADEVQAWANVGYQAGLMARHSNLSSSRRYHPLMREFLERRLQQLVTPDELRGMHLRVAQAAEASDWLTSCRHYIKADHEADALRVLLANVAKVLGSGQWGEGASLARTLRASDDDARIAVILAREDIYAGRIREGLARLERFNLADLDGQSRGLVVLARMHALWWLAQAGRIIDLLDEASNDANIPGEHAPLIAGLRTLVAASRDGSLARAAEHLEALVRSLDASELPFYAAITYHNLLEVRLAQGRYEPALAAGYRAIELFRQVPHEPDEAASTHLSLARTLAEMGRWSEVEAELRPGTDAAGIGRPERLMEAVGLLAKVGDVARAEALLRQVDEGDPQDVERIWYQRQLNGARLALATQNPERALSLVPSTLDGIHVSSVAGWVQWLTERSEALIVVGRDEEAIETVAQARHLAERQGADAYRAKLRVLTELAARRQLTTDVLAQASQMDILSCADAIAERLDLVPDGAGPILTSIQQWPARWLPLLRVAIRHPARPNVIRAARLLDEFGELDDVRSLRALAKSKIRGLRGTDLGRGLARRRSPRLQVSDLGRVSFAVGLRSVDIASIRRRAAGLLCYLLTRKNQLATRDQVLDALWPDTNPEPALNSLNQTLYFLRRDIDPSYDDDFSVQYVHFESDLVWLDAELVLAESSEFHTRAANALERPHGLDESLGVVRLYRGRFAPEFEYEEWATGWRELLHGQFLHLAETSVAQLIAEERLAEAAEVAVRVLAIDPEAEYMERELIWLYGTLGARAAAAEQYGHYAEVQRGEYGVEPPTLEEMTAAR